MKRLYNDSDVICRRRNLRQNQTDAERKLWNILRNRQMLGQKFFRQYSVGPYVLDFYCPQYRLAVEIDGGQHGEFDCQNYDEQRTKYLKTHDIYVFRFWNNEVLKNIEGVWEVIKNYLDEHS